MGFPVYGYAQTLDDAVTDQLRTISSVPCAKLKSTDSVTVFEGGLLSICTRGTAAGVTSPANTSGGGAGTPTALPSVVKRRVKNTQDKDEQKETVSKENVVSMEFGRWSTFLSGDYENLNRDITTFEDGYKSDIWRLTVGGDFRPTESSVLGAAFIGTDQQGDFKSGGGFGVESLGVLAFGSYSPTDNSFIQFSGGYRYLSNERQRVSTFVSNEITTFSRIGSPEADFDTDEFSAGILAGYDFVVQNITLGPLIGLDWVYTNFGSYSEKGSSGLELSFHKDQRTSLQTSLGVQGSAALSTRYGVLMPQASFAWKHEFENDQRNVEVSFTGDTRAKRFIYQTERPDRDFFLLNAGLVFVLPDGIQLFGNYKVLLGHGYFDSHAGTIGFRMGF